MFIQTVSMLLLLLLVLAGGAVLYMGVFKAHRAGVSTAKKAMSGIFAYGLSAIFWLTNYSYHHIGW